MCRARPTSLYPEVNHVYRDPRMSKWTFSFDIVAISWASSTLFSDTNSVGYAKTRMKRKKREMSCSHKRRSCSGKMSLTDNHREARYQPTSDREGIDTLRRCFRLGKNLRKEARRLRDPQEASTKGAGELHSMQAPNPKFIFVTLNFKWYES